MNKLLINVLIMLYYVLCFKLNFKSLFAFFKMLFHVFKKLHKNHKLFLFYCFDKVAVLLN